jgi:biopolymer transport protein TolQ
MNLATLSPIILAVLALLAFFSVGSWVIIVLKLRLCRTLERNSREFADFFWETADLAAVDARTPDTPGCPLARVFKAGWAETLGFLDAAPADGRPARDIAAIDSIARSLRKTAAEELEAAEKDLGFLATTAATAPFIGLFGTVWGIMNAFQDIGQSGSTSLAIVAPGISEALFTTAIGLAAAIPASMGYNHLQQRLRKIGSGLDSFSSDFLNIVQKKLLGLPARN